MQRIMLIVLITGLLLAGTAAAQDNDRPVIAPDNVTQLTVLQRLGRGSFSHLDWSPDGKYLVVAGSMGIWRYDAQNLAAEPLLFEAYGTPWNFTLSSDSQWVAVTYFATLDLPGLIKLWHLPDGQPGLTVEGNYALFSADSQLLAVRTENAIQLWDIAAGDMVRAIELPSPYVKFALSRDSTRLVVEGNQQIQVWDMTTGQALADLVLPEDIESTAVSAITITPDGSQVVSANSNGTVSWWDAVTGEPLRMVDGPLHIDDMAFNPTGTLLALAGSGGLWVWDASTGEQRYILEDYKSWEVTFSPDGALWASGLSLWDMETGDYLRSMDGGDDATRRWTWTVVTGPRFSPDGSRLAKLDSDGSIWVWDVATGEHLSTLPSIHSGITRGAFSPDSRQLVTSGYGEVWRWDTATGENTLVFRNPTGYYSRTAAFSPDGSLIAAGYASHIVWLLDATTGAELHRLQSEGTGDRLHAGMPVERLVFSPDGSQLAFGSFDAGIKVWDVATAEEQAVLGAWHISVTDLAYDPTGSRLARACFASDTSEIWDITTGAEVCEFGHYATSVVFSLDGTLIAVGNTDSLSFRGNIGGTLSLWDTATCTEVRTLPGHTDPITGLAINPISGLLASGSTDGVRLWDITTGAELYHLESGSSAEITLHASHLAFSPDGTWLAVEHTGGEVWLLGIPRN